MEELFRLMSRFTDEQLERVQRAEKWVAGQFIDPESGGRCLLGHARDFRRGESGWEYDSPIGVSDHEVGLLFDRLSGTLPGFLVREPAVGRECSARAAEILAARRAQKAEEVVCSK